MSSTGRWVMRLRGGMLTLLVASSALSCGGPASRATRKAPVPVQAGLDGEEPDAPEVTTPTLIEVGDTLRIRVGIPRGRAMGRLTWELGPPLGVRDSVSVTGGTILSATLGVPVLEEWAGRSATLRVWFADAAGVVTEVAEVERGPYHFFPVREPLTGAVARFAGPSVGADAFVYDPRRDRIYTIHAASSMIAVTDLATMRSLPPVVLPEWPSALDLSLSGDSLIVTHAISHDVSFIDLGTFELLPAMHLSALDTLHRGGARGRPMLSGLQVAANGKAFVQLHAPSASGVRVVEIDLATKTHRLRRDAPRTGTDQGEWWRRMQASPDRQRIVVFDRECAHWYDARSDSFSRCGPVRVEGYFWQVTFAADGSRVAVGRAVLDEELALVTATPAVISVMHPDGQHVIALVEDSLVKIRISDGAYLARARLPIGPHRLVVLPDGRTLIAFNQQQVTKVDLERF